MRDRFQYRRCCARAKNAGCGGAEEETRGVDVPEV